MTEPASINVAASRSIRDPIVWFVAGSYVFSWTIWILSRGHHVNLTWHIHGATITFQSFPSIGLLGVLGTFGPGLSAMSVARLEKGRTGVNELWAGIKKWRFEIRWFLVAIFLFPLLGFLTLLLFGLAGGEISSPGNPLRWLRMLLLNIPLDPLWEELGWRAFLLRKLQSQRSGLRASLIVGLIWGPWHLPIYWRQTFEYKIWFLMMVVAFSIVFTWVFNRTKESLVAVVLMHSAVDATTNYLFAPTIYAQGFAIVRLEVLMIVCAALVVLFFSGPELGRTSPPPRRVDPLQV